MASNAPTGPPLAATTTAGLKKRRRPAERSKHYEACLSNVPTRAGCLAAQAHIRQVGMSACKFSAWNSYQDPYLVALAAGVPFEYLAAPLRSDLQRAKAAFQSGSLEIRTGSSPTAAVRRAPMCRLRDYIKLHRSMRAALQFGIARSDIVSAAETADPFCLHPRSQLPIHNNAEDAPIACELVMLTCEDHLPGPLIAVMEQPSHVHTGPKYLHFNPLGKDTKIDLRATNPNLNHPK